MNLFDALFYFVVGGTCWAIALGITKLAGLAGVPSELPLAVVLFAFVVNLIGEVGE